MIIINVHFADLDFRLLSKNDFFVFPNIYMDENFQLSQTILKVKLNNLASHLWDLQHMLFLLIMLVLKTLELVFKLLLNRVNNNEYYSSITKVRNRDIALTHAVDNTNNYIFSYYELSNT